MLRFVYLANDVILRMARKGAEYARAFAPVMGAALALVYSKSGEKVRKSLRRILDIWAERNAFGPDLIKDFRSEMSGRGGGGGVTPSSISSSSSSSSSSSVHTTISGVANAAATEGGEELSDSAGGGAVEAGAPVDFVSLISNVLSLDQKAPEIQVLHDAAQSDLATVGTVDNASTLDAARVDEKKFRAVCAQDTLAAARDVLSGVVVRREMVIKTLQRAMVQQRRLLDECAGALTTARGRTEHFARARAALEAHLESLPDSNGAAAVQLRTPLPSASDLFGGGGGGGSGSATTSNKLKDPRRVLPKRPVKRMSASGFELTPGEAEKSAAAAAEAGQKSDSLEKFDPQKLRREQRQRERQRVEREAKAKRDAAAAVAAAAIEADVEAETSREDTGLAPKAKRARA